MPPMCGEFLARPAPEVSPPHEPRSKARNERPAGRAVFHGRRHRSVPALLCGWPGVLDEMELDRRGQAALVLARERRCGTHAPGVPERRGGRPGTRRESGGG